MSRIQRFIKFLAQYEWREEIPLPEWEVQRAEYILPGEYRYETESSSVENVERLRSTYGTTYFLRLQPEIPAAWGADETALVFEAGGEGLLRLNGEAYHGLDRNHTYVPLPIAAAGRTPLLEIELYDPIPEPWDPLNRQAVINPPISGISSKLVRVNYPVQRLKHSVTVAAMAARLLPEGDMRRIRTEQALEQAMDALYGSAPSRLESEELVSGVEQQLSEAVASQMTADAIPGTMHMVGQSHIDIAWLWPVRETVRKVSRTFSTVCALMDRYPDFKYSQSQPILYAFVKDNNPELYERIKQRIAEGRWELVGGMWVEPDLNIPSGESLVRQMLYGQRFFEREFGKRSAIEWLPDTFGYCASLPQLLKLAGIDYFMTTKLGWNDTNKFPYDLFHWVGIDGTSIVAYQNHGVNEHTHPKDVHEHWASFRQKDEINELMLLYGHGDGGGGVTHEMVEYVERAHLMPGQPLSRFATAADFFGAIAKRNPDLPQWHGDLYLELHRGTYTTHARNKRNNRKAEALYREAEIWSALAIGDEQQGMRTKQALDKGWELMLLNQFHDIIPGTSIPEVYFTSAKEYERIFDIGQAELDQTLSAVVTKMTGGQYEGEPYVVFNSLGWEREEIVILDAEQWRGRAPYDAAGPMQYDLLPPETEDGAERLAVRVTGIPAFGSKTFWLRETEEVTEKALTGTEGTLSANVPVPEQWETAHYLLKFNARGEITSWYDKAAGRELIAPGGKGNELQFFHDTPTYWDAWDIDPRYESQPAGTAELLESEVMQRGSVMDVLRFRWKLNASIIDQEIMLYHHRRRVDFRTKVDWHESHKLLKVAFPVDIVASKATYEIPFGALERPTHRNTSWDQAQFEVCGHRWADLSEGGYGVSLLNDCKYGYDIKDGVMRLSLLRAPKWPDQGADQGKHEFTYSLLPHEKDWREAHVVREAAELNQAVVAVQAPSGQSGRLPAEHSWLHLESTHVILDTIKRAEDGSGTILRFYESSGGRETVTIKWPTHPIDVSVVNLLEDEMEDIATVNGEINLSFRPYEVKTIKIKLQDQHKEVSSIG